MCKKRILRAASVLTLTAALVLGLLGCTAADSSVLGDANGQAQVQTGGLLENAYASEENEQNLELNKQMQDVSIRIFKQTASSKKNSMVSPISVITAMGMVENGAAEIQRQKWKKPSA